MISNFFTFTLIVVEILFISINSVKGIEQSGGCRKWYSRDGCQNIIRFTKTIRNSDKAPFLSTRIRTNNPDKGLDCIIDFGTPPFHINQFRDSLLNDLLIPLNEDISSSSNNTNITSILTTPLINIINDMILKDNILTHSVLFIKNQIYINFNLKAGIRRTNIDENAFVDINTKGRVISLPFMVTDFDQSLNSISPTWVESLLANNYQALLNFGRHSNIWNSFDNMIINSNQIIFSVNDQDSSTAPSGSISSIAQSSTKSFFNEHKITIHCNKAQYSSIVSGSDVPLHQVGTVCVSNEKLQLITDNNNNNGDDYTNDLQNQDTITTKEQETYELEINLMSSENYLPSKLYFMLYSPQSNNNNGQTTSQQQQQQESIFKTNFRNVSRISRKNANNILELAILRNNGDETTKPQKTLSNIGSQEFTWKFPSYSKIVFELNTNNDNRIVLGADALIYFSQIYYDRTSDYYILWVDDATNQQTMVVLLSFVVVIEMILIIIWYVSSHWSITCYIFLKILLGRRYFYYNNARPIIEICAIFLAFCVIGTDLYLIVSSFNVTYPFIFSYCVLSVLIFFMFIFNVIFIYDTKGLFYKFLCPPDKLEQSLNNNKNKSFSEEEIEEEEDDDDDFKLQQEEIQSARTRLELEVDKKNIGTYAISNGEETLFADLLIVISRNYVHITMVLATILLCLLPVRDLQATKIFIAGIALYLIYEMVYYLFLLYCAYRRRTSIQRSLSTMLWAIYIGFNIIFLVFIVTPFSSLFIIFNLFDETNSSYQIFFVIVLSVFSVLLVIILAIRNVFSSMGQWIDNIIAVSRIKNGVQSSIKKHQQQKTLMALNLIKNKY